VEVQRVANLKHIVPKKVRDVTLPHAVALAIISNHISSNKDFCNTKARSSSNSFSSNTSNTNYNNNRLVEIHLNKITKILLSLLAAAVVVVVVASLVLVVTA
jgi:hypothetical protein